MKTSKYLHEEKKTCKAMENRILKDIAIAMPQGKNFYIITEDVEAKPGHPHIVTRVLWKEKRDGAQFEGHVAGKPEWSVLLALTHLRDKAHERARARK